MGREEGDKGAGSSVLSSARYAQIRALLVEKNAFLGLGLGGGGSGRASSHCYLLLLLHARPGRIFKSEIGKGKCISIRNTCFCFF